MAFNLGNKIVKSAKHLQNKIHKMKIEYKVFTESKNREYELNSTKDIPEKMKYNPYFWKDQFKRKFLEGIEKLSNKKINNIKMLNKDETFNPLTRRINEQAQSLASYVKNSAVSIIESLKDLIVKISNNYLDVKNFNSKKLVKTIKNIPVCIFNLVNVKALIATYHKIGIYLSRLNRESARYMTKYRDPQIYNEYKRNYDSFFKKIEEKTKNKKNFFKTENFQNFAKKVNFSKYRLIFDKNYEKVNKFVKFPTYKQKFYNLNFKLQNIWQNRRDYWNYYNSKASNFKGMIKRERISYYYDKARNTPISELKNYFSEAINKRLRKIIFYFLSILCMYYGLKYFMYRITDGKQDKNLKEALNVINDIKKQNEELIRYNEKLVQTILDNRKN